jgi:hypothetical protein
MVLAKEAQSIPSKGCATATEENERKKMKRQRKEEEK